MTISSVVQRGSTAFVYNEKNQTSCTISVGSGEFHSCAGTINIKRGSTLYMYDEKGRSKGTRSV